MMMVYSNEKYDSICICPLYFGDILRIAAGFCSFSDAHSTLSHVTVPHTTLHVRPVSGARVQSQSYIALAWLCQIHWKIGMTSNYENLPKPKTGSRISGRRRPHGVYYDLL